MFRLYPSEMVWMDRTYFIVIDYYISFPSFFLSFFFFFSFTIMSHVDMGWNGIADIS